VSSNNLSGGGIFRNELGAKVVNGKWQTVTRDLEADVAKALLGVKILAVNGFRIQGRARVDDIGLYAEMPVG